MGEVTDDSGCYAIYF